MVFFETITHNQNYGIASSPILRGRRGKITFLARGRISQYFHSDAEPSDSSLGNTARGSTAFAQNKKRGVAHANRQTLSGRGPCNAETGRERGVGWKARGARRYRFDCHRVHIVGELYRVAAGADRNLSKRQPGRLVAAQPHGNISSDEGDYRWRPGRRVHQGAARYPA